MISVFHSCCCHHLIATYLNYYRNKVLSCKLEHLIYVEDDDDDDDAVDEDEEDDGQGFGRSRKGDVARAARLLGISLPQLGTKQPIQSFLSFPLSVPHKIIHQGRSPLITISITTTIRYQKTHPIVPIISTLYPL